jgi:hypothetical protein
MQKFYFSDNRGIFAIGRKKNTVTLLKGQRIRCSATAATACNAEQHLKRIPS